jgi:ArsR family transcriptional regulator
MLCMATDQTAQRLDETLKALADPLRLRMLALVAEHEVCVCYLVEVLHTVQPVVSRQLAYLRRAGLVESRRDGKWIHYRLHKPQNESAAALLSEALRHVKRGRQMQADLAKLADCSQHRSGNLKDAPLPQRIKR